MGYLVNRERIYRDICDNSDLNLGALGVLAYMFFNTDDGREVTLDHLCEMSQKDSKQDVKSYLDQLILLEYIEGV